MYYSIYSIFYTQDIHVSVGITINLDILCRVKSAEINGINYTIQSVILFGWNQGQPTFGEIVAVFVLPNSSVGWMPTAASLASLPLVSPGALVSSSGLAGVFTQASLGATVSTTPSTGGS